MEKNDTYYSKLVIAEILFNEKSLQDINKFLFRLKTKDQGKTELKLLNNEFKSENNLISESVFKELIINELSDLIYAEYTEKLNQKIKYNQNLNQNYNAHLNACSDFNFNILSIQNQDIDQINSATLNIKNQIEMLESENLLLKKNSDFSENLKLIKVDGKPIIQENQDNLDSKINISIGKNEYISKLAYLATLEDFLFQIKSLVEKGALQFSSAASYVRSLSKQIFTMKYILRK